MKTLCGSFLRDERAAVTVEFVVVMLFYIWIVFFVLEVAIAQFWWQTAEKAVQLGARLAVVSDPVVSTYTCGSAVANEIPATNCLDGSNANAAPGGACSASPSNCTSFTTVTKTCVNAACTSSAPFKYIIDRMGQTFIPIKDGTVTISYAYSGLGYAGGPNLPLVTVTLSGVRLKLGFISIIGNIMGKSAGPLFNIPTMSVTMTAEDLQSSSSSS